MPRITHEKKQYYKSRISSVLSREHSVSPTASSSSSNSVEREASRSKSGTPLEC